MADENITWDQPKEDITWDTAPPAAAPARALPGYQKRQHAYRESIHTGSPELPAGAAADVKAQPELRHTGEQLAGKWGQFGKGLAKGVPAGIAGGIVGDIEEMGRHAINKVAEGEVVSPHTAIPTTTEGGYLGPKGLNVMAPAASEDEKLGMGLTAPVGPGVVAKLGKAALSRLPARVPPETPPPAPVREAPPGFETVDTMSGKPPVSPTAEADLLPRTPDGSPIAVPREGSGARLLPADVPHVETAGSIEDTLAGRRSAGAAGRSPLEEFSPETIAHMRKTLEQEGVTPWTLEQRLEEMSPHQSLAEFSPNTEAHAGATASPPGAGKNEIINFFGQRAREAKDRMRSTFDQAFGPAEDLAQQNRVLNIDQSAEAGPLYDRFRSMEIPPTPSLDALVPRLQSVGAFGEARAKALAEGRPWQQEWFTPEQRSAPTAQSWDYVKRALDQKIGGSYDPVSGRATDWTRIYTNLKNDLLSAINRHPDPEIASVWREARQAWAGPEEVKNAQRLGRRLLTKAVDADEFRFESAGFGEHQLQGLRQGLRKELETSLGNPGKTELPVMKQVLGENNQQKLRWVIGDEATDALVRSIEHEFNMHSAPTRIHGNSPTALRQEANKFWTPQEGFFSAKDLASALHGLSGAAAHVAKKTFMARHAANQEAKFARLRDEAARIYTMQGPERDAVLRYLLSEPPSPTRITVHPAPGRGIPRAKGGRIIKRADGGRTPKVDYQATDLGKTSKHEIKASYPITNNVDLTASGHTYSNEPYREKPQDWGASIGLRKNFAEGGAPQQTPAELIARGVSSAWGGIKDYFDTPVPMKSGVAPLDDMPEPSARITVRPLTKRPDEQLGEVGHGVIKHVTDSLDPWKRDDEGKPYADQPIAGVGKTPETQKGLFDYGLTGADLASNFLGGPEVALGKVIATGAKLGAGAIKAGPKGWDAVHAMSSIPRAEAEKIMAENAARGLSFPEEKTANELRLNLQREQALVDKGKELPGGPLNERRVIRSGNPDLPDFVTGKLTFDDWMKRQEHLLSPEEIQDAALWYSKVYDEFLKQTKGDAAKASKYMRGWLVAQQNIDVGGALNNVLLQSEQVARGVPEKKMAAAGMPNPTIAARRIMQDKPIEEGIGQKIADFVDAAEGKSVRSWMGNHPAGGAPAVVDIHTGRDTGFMDDRFMNHLKRLGYNQDDLKGLKRDITTSAKGPQYENRAKWLRDLTDHLNETGWQGKTDWTPSEAQAVGWMGMTRLTADKAEDVVSGLNLNTRNLSMELSPGAGSPWDVKYGSRFGALPIKDQYEITHALTQQAVDMASKLAGIDVRDIVHATGGWKFGDSMGQAPSTVAQALATSRGAQIAANYLAHVLQQTEVWANKVKPLTANPKGFAVDFIASGENNVIRTDQGLRDLWQKLTDADPQGKTNKPLFQGYQPIVDRDGNPGIRVLIDRGGVKTKENLEAAVSGPIKDVLGTMPYDVGVRLNEAEIYKATNDWKAQKNGQGHSTRLGQLLGRHPAADLRRDGAQLEAEFRRRLEAAEARTKAGQGRQEEVGAGALPLAKAAAPDRASGGGVFEAATRLARKYRAEGGDVSDDAPFDEPAQAQAARERAAVGVARGVKHPALRLGDLPPEGSGVAPAEAFPQKTWMIEPDLQGYQSGDYGLPEGAALDDANRPFYPDTGRRIEVIPRPGTLPLVRTPDGYQFAMPKLLDLASNVMSPLAAGRVPVKAGEMVLGSGAVRTRNVPPADNVYWHGTASGDLRGGSSGLHLGTREQATAALEARIGIPADGMGWTGSRPYGETLLAGSDSIKSGKFGPYRESGFNAGFFGGKRIPFPKEDFYASEFFAAHPELAHKYPDGTPMPLDVKPTVDPYRITGNMTNSPDRPHPDFKANGYMKAQLKKGNPKSGYFYDNQGEGEGISAVVPHGGWVEKVPHEDRNLGKTLYSDTQNQVAGEVGHQVEKAAQPGIRAWHASPHDFDKFDISKVGTGQGAQSYGHGIYAAENPKVSGRGGEYWNEFLRHFRDDDPQRLAAEILQRHKFDRAKALADEELNINLKHPMQDEYGLLDHFFPTVEDKVGYAQRRNQLHKDVKRLLESGQPVGPRAYELDIKGKPEEFLDWDRPLSMQPQTVKEFVGKQPARVSGNTMRRGQLAEPRGEDIYRRLGDARETTAALRDAGVPGIRYFDAGSRHGGTGNTSNYVVFDDKLINILKKYGIALPGAGVAAAGAGKEGVGNGD